MSEQAPSLTPRELEVLRLICGGTTHNRAIAVRLTITEFTVETHVKRIMVKLSASNRAEIIIRAYAQGLA